jgi:hypothetical protein
MRRVATTAINVAHARAPSSVERWYVLILMCLIYAINIADRYVVSTVLEPIRIELHLTTAGSRSSPAYRSPCFMSLAAFQYRGSPIARIAATFYRFR